jgi:hypothetical protein
MAKRNGHAPLYKSYVFKDRDPIMDAFDALREGAKISYAKIHEQGGPTVSTLRAWSHARVKRPQHATIAAAASAVGATGVMFNSGHPYFITSVVRPSLKLVVGARRAAQR